MLVFPLKMLVFPLLCYSLPEAFSAPRWSLLFLSDPNRRRKQGHVTSPTTCPAIADRCLYQLRHPLPPILGRLALIQVESCKNMQKHTGKDEALFRRLALYGFNKHWTKNLKRSQHISNRHQQNNCSWTNRCPWVPPQVLKQPCKQLPPWPPSRGWAQLNSPLSSFLGWLDGWIDPFIYIHHLYIHTVYIMINYVYFDIYCTYLIDFNLVHWSSGQEDGRQ